MLCKRNTWAGCLLLSFLFGCAPKIEYVPKTEYDAIADQYRLVQEQMSINKERTKKLEQQLYEMRQEKARLDDQMKTLKKTIREKETVISLQGKVIKLLDDSDQTLQKSIEEQIAPPKKQE